MGPMRGYHYLSFNTIIIIYFVYMWRELLTRGKPHPNPAFLSYMLFNLSVTRSYSVLVTKIVRQFPYLDIRKIGLRFC